MLEIKLFFLGWSSRGLSLLQSTTANCHNDSAHVHLEEPGKQDWEGFWTGTQAAAAGGVTTLIDMPVDSSPPTTTPRNLDIKRHSARGQCWVDVGFWGGAIPQNQVSAPAGSSVSDVHHLRGRIGTPLIRWRQRFQVLLDRYRHRGNSKPTFHA